MKSKKIIDIMATTFSVEKSMLSEEVSQKNLISWDSLSHLNLIVALEEAFDVSFEPEQIAIMTSFKAILDELEKIE